MRYSILTLALLALWGCQQGEVTQPQSASYKSGLTQARDLIDIGAIHLEQGENCEAIEAFAKALDFKALPKSEAGFYRRKLLDIYATNLRYEEAVDLIDKLAAQNKGLLPEEQRRRDLYARYIMANGSKPDTRTCYLTPDERPRKVIVDSVEPELCYQKIKSAYENMVLNSGAFELSDAETCQKYIEEYDFKYRVNLEE